MRITKKRLAFGAGTATAIGAAATLIAGTTFGLFSASDSSGSNSFTAGTVSVAAGSPTSVTCTITNMVPGDSSAGAASGSQAKTTCTYNVKYTGSAPAYLAVDAAVANGTTPLYDGTNQGLQLYLKDGAAASYLTSTAGNGQTASGAGTTYTNEGGATTSGLTTAGVQNLLVSTTAASTNDTVNFSLDYVLPLSSGNGYQGGSATVTLTFHAVQSGNQTLPVDCAAGQQCNATGSFAWS